jgi:hypothetical protein
MQSLFFWLALAATATTAMRVDDHAAPPPYADNLSFHEKYRRYSERRLRAAAERYAPRRTFAPSSDTCSLCELTAEVMEHILVDTELTNVTHALAAAWCAAKSSDPKLCDAIADAALEIALHTFSFMDRVHWNVPVSICADVLRVCEIPCCLNDTRAEQIHLSFVDSDPVAPTQQLRVTWVTRFSNTSQAVSFRAVNSTSAPSQAPATTLTTYAVGGWLGYTHSAVLSSLAAGTRYQYEIVADGHAISNAIEFSTLPTNIGTPERPMRVGSLADMGYHNVSDDTVASLTALVEAGEIDFVIHYGDIGYADGNEADWDRFMRKIEPIASRVPYMTTPGNHECLWNFTAYRNRLIMPVPSGQPPEAMYYDFTVGGAHFVMMDSESWINTAEIKDMELEWLEGVLTGAASQRQFIIVSLHRPLYCTTQGTGDCGASAEYLRGRVEGLFVTHGVDMVTVGHMHNYERTLPLVNNTVRTSNLTNPRAPMYIVNGAAGNKEGQSGFGPAMPWTASRTMDYGFAVHTIDTTADRVSTMTSQFLRAKDRAVIDSFTLTSTK